MAKKLVRFVVTTGVLACLLPDASLDVGFAALCPFKALPLLTRQHTKLPPATVTRKAAEDELAPADFVKELVKDYHEDGHDGNDVGQWIDAQCKKHLKTVDILDMHLLCMTRLAEQGYYLDAKDRYDDLVKDTKFDMASVGKERLGDDNSDICVIVDVSMAQNPQEYDRSALFVLFSIFRRAGQLEKDKLEEAVGMEIQTARSWKGERKALPDPSMEEWQLSHRRVVQQWLAQKDISFTTDGRSLIINQQSICEVAARMKGWPNSVLRRHFGGSAEYDVDEEDEDEDEENFDYDDDDDFEDYHS